MKYLLILIPLLYSLPSNSQDLSFEETVNYIENFFMNYQFTDDIGQHTYDVKHISGLNFELSGKLEFDDDGSVYRYEGTFNLEDYSFDLSDYSGFNVILEGSFKEHRTYGYVNRLATSNKETKNESMMHIPVNKTNGNRIVKAFKHLASLYKDPFDD